MWLRAVFLVPSFLPTVTVRHSIQIGSPSMSYLPYCSFLCPLPRRASAGDLSFNIIFIILPHMFVHEVLQRRVARAIMKLEHGEVGIDEKVVSEVLVHVPHIEEPLQVSKHRVRFRTVQLGRLHDPDMVSLGQLLLLERLNLGDAPAVIALGMIEGEGQDLERVRMHRVHVLQAPVEELGVVAYPRGVDYHGDVSLEIVELEPFAGGVPRSQVVERLVVVVNLPVLWILVRLFVT
mmetsp:Transcript_22859/g.52487  ORF Transcript_22859/g.52487 Transcript_22859/m.52487 type:complete len:235 (+) Transcript_22859:42-746(+)